jgi:ribokinase
MTRVVISGYASLDHVLTLTGPLAADRTTIMRRGEAAWGRLGGSPSYVGRALAKSSTADVALVSWVGGDALGETYRRALEEEGLDAKGVETRSGRTPVAILAYQPDGACLCLYDPGLDRVSDLSASQREIVAAADWICVTIGPAAATREIVAATRPQAKLVWAVKNDPHSCPPDVVALLVARADVISHSRGETDFVQKALAAAPERVRLVVETKGAEGARASWRGDSFFVPAENLTVGDPTGAGDAFVGGLIAGLVDNDRDPAGALARASKAARRLLVERGPPL